MGHHDVVLTYPIIVSVGTLCAVLAIAAPALGDDAGASAEPAVSVDESDDGRDVDTLDEDDVADVPAEASATTDEPGNVYASMDLAELMEIRVTSVTGVDASFFETPAALTVITSDDMRRAGHRSIPEALRLVPGMHVARLDSGIWAISARGFNSEFANKLQVLMDGRRLYDPLFSGVYWDVQDYVIEDIDRIEVIRGPGATLWGANAVNGVVNITTKPASETQGLYVTGGAGSFERGFGAVRYGGQIDDDAHFRIYGKYRNFDSMPSEDAGERPDDWDMWQGGARFDIGDPQETMLTIQGDAFHMPYRGTRSRVADPSGHLLYESRTSEERATGGNAMAKLHHEGDHDSHWTLKAYYDRLDRKSRTGFSYTRDSFDLDWRHNVHMGDRHEVMWGLNYRHDRLDSTPRQQLAFDPDSRSINTWSGFVQDTITFAPDRLFGMVGTKLEHNDFSGFEVQPSARLWWTPDDKQTLWGAVSRPVRTPSWSDQDIELLAGYVDPGLLAGGPPQGFTVPLMLLGDRDVESEKLLAWELGYRRRLTDELTIDVAGFYNRYSDLVDFVGTNFANAGRADTYGVELSSDWEVAENWTLEGSYSFLQMRQGDSFSADAWAGSSPEHQFQIHSRLDVTDDLELNAGLYFVDHLAAQRTDEYYRADVGLTWRPRENVELSVWGQNLLDNEHMEFESFFLVDSPALVERSVTVQASFRF